MLESEPPEEPPELEPFESSAPDDHKLASLENTWTTPERARLPSKTTPSGSSPLDSPTRTVLPSIATEAPNEPLSSEPASLSIWLYVAPPSLVR